MKEKKSRRDPLEWEEVSTEHLVQDEWGFLLKVPSNATIADNYAYLFEAKNCRLVSAQELDDMEFLNVIRLTEKEISRMITEGEFQQAIHIAAWLMTKRK